MIVGCTDTLIVRFRENPDLFDDYEIVFEQGDKEVITYHKANMDITSGQDIDGNQEWVGIIKMHPSDTSKFKPGIASVRCFGIIGEDRISNDNKVVIKVTE